MTGLQALQEWLPVGWLTIVDGAGAATTPEAREAVASAIATTLMAVATRILWTTARGIGRALSGGGYFATPKGALSGLRWLAGVAFVVAPWVRVYSILQGEGDDVSWRTLSLLAGALWGVHVAADHRAASVRGETPSLRLTRGFAIFQKTQWQIPLGDALIDADVGLAIGSVRGGRRRVRLRPDVLQALTETLGEDEGRQWLQRWLVRHDLKLLGGVGSSAQKGE